MTAATIAHPLEVEEGLARAGGDLEFYKELLEMFLDAAPDHVAELRELVAAGDTEALCRVAHGLKGAAANLSAGEVSSVVSAIESTSRAESSEGITERIDTLEAKIAELREFAATL